jgi:hypothetical protein
MRDEINAATRALSAEYGDPGTQPRAAPSQAVAS